MTNLSLDLAVEEVSQILRNLQKPEKWKHSPWLAFHLTVNYVKAGKFKTESQAVKEVFSEALDLLSKENADYADILRGRYWEEITVKEMVAIGRPKQWEERTFYHNQKDAIKRFTTLLLEIEKAHQKLTNNQNDTYLTSESVSILTTPQVDDGGLRNNRHFYVLAASVAALMISAVLFISQMQLPNPRPSQIAAITATIDAKTTPSQPILTSKPTVSLTTTTHVDNPLFVCGELARVVAPDTNRFLRNQGISAFTVENTNKTVLNNYVRTVFIGTQGLWIGYFATKKNPINGVSHYNKKDWANCNHVGFTEGQNVNSVVTDNNGHLWVGTEKSGIDYWDGKSWRTYTTQNGLPSNEIFELIVDNDNNVWAGTWEGVAKFDGLAWSVPYSVKNDTIFNNHVHAILIDQNKNIWIGHINRGISLLRYSDSKWVHITDENGLGGNEIRRIVTRKETASSESVWVATADGGISKFENDQWVVYTVKNGLPSNTVYTVAVDKYNRVWAATAGGVSYFDKGHWLSYNTLDTLSLAFGPNCLQQDCPIDDEHIWTGTKEFGLTHSRLPYPDSAINVLEVCFVTPDKERICPPIITDKLSNTITITYPTVLAPNAQLRFEIIVSPHSGHQLKVDRGDFLSNVDESDFNLLGAYPIIGVQGTIEPGQPFVFTDYDNPFRVPEWIDGSKNKQFVSTWRVWMWTRYTGPYIRLIINAQQP